VPTGRHIGAGGAGRYGRARARAAATAWRQAPTSAPVWLRWALPRPYGGACEAVVALRASEGRVAVGQGSRQRRGGAGRELGAFRRRSRPSLLSILSSLDSACCAVCRRFSRFPMDVLARAARHLFEAHDPAGSGGCVPLSVRCTRTLARHDPPFYWLLVIAHRQLSDRIFSCGA
jgi:hypothetical protein